MDVLEQTSIRLSFQDRTVLSYWRVACLYTLGTAVVFGILAAPFTSFGLRSIWLVLTHEQMATLTCDRTDSPPGRCQLVRSRFVGREVITFPLRDLQNATVQSKSRFLNRQAGRVTYYRVLLNTQTGSIRLTVDNLSNRAEQQTLATQINTFINSPAKPFLKVQQKGSTLDWFVILVFVPLSLMPILVPLVIMFPVSLYLLRSTICTLDKALGTITVEHQGLKTFGNKELFDSKIIQHSIEEIAEVQVEAFPGNERYWNLVAVLKTGKRLPLIWMATPGKEQKQAMANRIRRFLNLATIDRQ